MTADYFSRDQVMELNVLRGAIENTNEAFVTIDQDSVVIFFNKAAEEIFGYNREEVIGKNLASILSPACREGHTKAVRRYVSARDPKLIGHETEFIAMRKNGASFPASISFSVAELNGKLFFTGIVRDLTETKNLHDQLIRSERLAALGQTVAEISHEIKNPLMLIGGFAKQLLKNARDEKVRIKLDLIAGEVRRLEHLLAELKDLYTPRGLIFEKISVYELLQEVYTLVETDCDCKNIAIALKVENGDICLRGDREKVKQVLLNIVKNSIEAVSTGDVITIDAEPTGEQVTISITDSGPGIPEEIRQKIFSPFFTTKKQGTGLGLSVSKRIIEDHPRSSLEIQSQNGKGTLVKIILPRC